MWAQAKGAPTLGRTGGQGGRKAGRGRQEKQGIKSRDKGGDTVQALDSRVRVPRKSNEWGRGRVLGGPLREQ